MKKKITAYLFLIIVFSYKIYAIETHEELIEKLEMLFPLEIHFQQTTQQNKTIEGWMILGGKGKVRTEFQPPNNLVIVGTGKWLIFHDAQYDRTTYLPMDKGILNSILNPITLKDSREIEVTKESTKDITFYDISSKKKNYEGRLRISFSNKRNSEILEWKITDRNKNNTNVKVKKINRLKLKEIENVPFFSFTEDMRNSKNAFLGPYKKRELKKIPKSGRPGDY